MNKITSMEMRRINREKIFRLIYDERRITRAEIAHRLQMSLPTITRSLKDLEDGRLIRRDGVFQSTGGRKPQMITCAGDVRIAIGVEISGGRIDLAAVDIYGEVIEKSKFALKYEDTDRYYREFGRRVMSFCGSLPAPRERILGVGMAIQGTPSPDGTTVMHGKILLTTGLRLENFTRHLDFPCRMIQDVKAAALAELWSSRDIGSAVYLFLGQYLGGKLILDRNIVDGRQVRGAELLGGYIEHMTLRPGGEPCYCGRKGCFSAYCSASCLADGTDDIPSFFEHLRGGSPAHAAKWRKFLDNLAVAAGSIHMMISCGVILGGHLAPYLREEDIAFLQTRVHGCADCPPEDFFIRTGAVNGVGVARGAALPFIEQFLRSMSLLSQ